MELIISLLILIIVVWLVFYIIDMLGLPGPIPMVAKLIIGVVVLLYILQHFLPSLGGHSLKFGSLTPTYTITQMVT